MTIIVANGTLIDGLGGDPKPNASVVVEGSKIREIRSSSSGATNGAEVIDATGRYVIPGLIDSHLHLGLPFDDIDDPIRNTPVTDERFVALAGAYGLANARTYISSGVTTVRDLGSYAGAAIAVRDLVNTGQAPGPTILAGGRAIAMTGGHALPICVEADGSDGVAEAVRRQVHIGADILKFMASGSGASPAESPHHVHLSPEELAAGIGTARRLGRTSAVHATNPEAIMNAVKAGAKTIEHGILADDEALQAMLANSVSLVPTLWAYHFAGEYGSYMKIPDDVTEVIKSRYGLHLDMVRRAHEMGVAIVAGTDAAVPIIPRNCLTYELAWLVEAGLTPMDALQAATINAAIAIERDDRIGSIEVGKIADIVVLDADPLEDVRNTTKTWSVLKGGEVVVEESRLVWQEAMRAEVPIPEGPYPATAPEMLGAP